MGYTYAQLVIADDDPPSIPLDHLMLDGDRRRDVVTLSLADGGQLHGSLARLEAWFADGAVELSKLRAARSAQEELDFRLVAATPESVAHQLLGVELLDADAGLGPEAA